MHDGSVLLRGHGRDVSGAQAWGRTLSEALTVMASLTQAVAKDSAAPALES
jgi:hypothetical protein